MAISGTRLRFDGLAPATGIRTDPGWYTATPEEHMEDALAALDEPRRRRHAGGCPAKSSSHYDAGTTRVRYAADVAGPA